MNSEYLLDAIGLLDDDLVREAEDYRRSQPKRSYASWLGWAASFAVVIVLGYGLTHLPMGGGGNMSPACSSPAASAPNNESSGGGEIIPAPGEDADCSQSGFPTEPDTAEPSAPSGSGGASSFDLSDQMLSVKVCLPGTSRTWSFSHWYGEDRTVDTLPKGCQSLGVIEEWSKGTTAPYTNNDEYLGCEVWFMRANFSESGHNELYVELPEGGYLECR